jgi:hypothetical protein
MNDYGYGLWPLVVINSLVFIIFAASFFHPKTKRDWRALGGFSAFVVALFTEMFGYPLTVYLLSGPLGGLVPGLNLSHSAGHIWNDLIGWTGDPHLSPFHLASYVFIGGGFWLIPRLHPDHGRLLAPMADPRDACDVPDSAGRLPAARDPRGARSSRRVRGSVGPLRGRHAALPAPAAPVALAGTLEL